MNKQEKEKFIEKILSWGSWCNEVHTGELDRYVKISKVRELIKCVNEPQKVKVPEFVAAWYEMNKKNLEYRIWKYIKNWDDQRWNDFKNWMDKNSVKSLEILTKMQYGYEVEEEPKWVVKFQNKHELPFYFDHFNGLKGKGNQYFDFAYTTKEKAERFIDKSIADSVATLVNGTVEKV